MFELTFIYNCSFSQVLEHQPAVPVVEVYLEITTQLPPLDKLPQVPLETRAFHLAARTIRHKIKLASLSCQIITRQPGAACLDNRILIQGLGQPTTRVDSPSIKQTHHNRCVFFIDIFLYLLIDLSILIMLQVIKWPQSLLYSINIVL